MKGRIGVLVGMRFEADLVRCLHPAVIEVGGATLEGTKKAIDRLMASKVDGIVSFGFAAGLDPLLKAGTVLVPYGVVLRGRDYMSDPVLRNQLGAERSEVKVGALWHSDCILTDSKEKQVVFERTGCIAADMESGLIAEACQRMGIPFAVLRVVCDSADRDLPPLVSQALAPDGRLDLLGILKDFLTQPGQIGDLVGVGLDMLIAYWKLRRFVSVE